MKNKIAVIWNPLERPSFIEGIMQEFDAEIELIVSSDWNKDLLNKFNVFLVLCELDWDKYRNRSGFHGVDWMESQRVKCHLITPCIFISFMKYNLVEKRRNDSHYFEVSENNFVTLYSEGYIDRIFLLMKEMLAEKGRGLYKEKLQKYYLGKQEDLDRIQYAHGNSFVSGLNDINCRLNALANNIVLYEKEQDLKKNEDLKFLKDQFLNDLGSFRTKESVSFQLAKKLFIDELDFHCFDLNDNPDFISLKKVWYNFSLRFRKLSIV